MAADRLRHNSAAQSAALSAAVIPAAIAKVLATDTCQFDTKCRPDIRQSTTRVATCITLTPGVNVILVATLWRGLLLLPPQLHVGDGSPKVISIIDRVTNMSWWRQDKRPRAIIPRRPDDSTLRVE